MSMRCGVISISFPVVGVSFPVVGVGVSFPVVGIGVFMKNEHLLFDFLLLILLVTRSVTIAFVTSYLSRLCSLYFLAM